MSLWDAGARFSACGHSLPGTTSRIPSGFARRQGMGWTRARTCKCSQTSLIWLSRSWARHPTRRCSALIPAHPDVALHRTRGGRRATHRTPTRRIRRGQGPCDGIDIDPHEPCAPLGLRESGLSRLSKPQAPGGIASLWLEPGGVLRDRARRPRQRETKGRRTREGHGGVRNEP